LSTHLRLGLHSGLFPSGFPTNILYVFLFSTFVLHALSTSLDLVQLDHSNYSWRRVQVMKLLIMQFSRTSCNFIWSVQIFSSTPCSQTPSVYVPHTHTEPQAKL
jgi:hypothetical protein